MKTKRITIEIPESTFLIDLTYYWKNAHGVVKASGFLENAYLTDGTVAKAFSNHFSVMEERDDG